MVRALTCPSCGAPLCPASGGAVICAYCQHVLVDVPDPFRARPVVVPPWPGRPEDRGKQRIAVGSRRYVVLGQLGHGDGSDVFHARRDARLGELVVLKLLRAAQDEDLLAREARILRGLREQKCEGAAHFRRLLPEVVVHGRARREDGTTTAATVFRFRSGFHHHLADVRRAYPRGVDPRAAIWMWSRLLEMLGWLRRANALHGAVLPPHLLVHPRDHGVVLVGWSAAALGPCEPLVAFSASHEPFYPRRVWMRGPAQASTDVIMSARSIAWVLGGEPGGRVPSHVPKPLARLIAACAREDAPDSDAWTVKGELESIARRLYGPPTYVRFEMPETPTA